MSHVIVRHVESLPISPGPHTCVHVAHTMRCLKGRDGEREGERESGWRRKQREKRREGGQEDNPGNH